MVRPRACDARYFLNSTCDRTVVVHILSLIYYTALSPRVVTAVATRTADRTGAISRSCVASACLIQLAYRNGEPRLQTGFGERDRTGGRSRNPVKTYLNRNPRHDIVALGVRTWSACLLLSWREHPRICIITPYSFQDIHNLFLETSFLEIDLRHNNFL
ncbi:hypothetical protein J6590_050652 [Homalodisca vitripennis]|nr:hypothetical protein J6590_050652 [Homalodisca vitripennis]